MAKAVKRTRSKAVRNSHMARLITLLDDMDINYCINKEPNEDFIKVSLMMSDADYGECYSFYFDLKGRVNG